MSYFARVQAGIVVEVIVSDQAHIDSGALGDPSEWIETCKNTYHGQHLEGGQPLRKNYAGAGYSYDPDLDAFVPPRPFPSWILNREIADWQAPVPYPDDGGIYRWDEARQAWQERQPLE